MLNSFATTVATPRKCPGRNMPQRCSDTPATSTNVLAACGYISSSRRRENEIHAARGAELQVLRHVDSVGFIIVAPVELNRIDEDADHHDMTIGAGPLHQRAMPGVQSAHCRRQPDGPAPLARQRQPARAVSAKWSGRSATFIHGWRW